MENNKSPQSSSETPDGRVGSGALLGPFLLRDGETVETESGTYIMRQGYLHWQSLNSRFSLRRAGFALLRRLFGVKHEQPWLLCIPRDLAGKYIRPLGEQQANR